MLVEKFLDNIEYYCLIFGLFFVIEVFENVLIMINIVGLNLGFLFEVLKIFNNKYFRLIINFNEKGSELFAVFKNVFVIGIGVIIYMFFYKNIEFVLLVIGVKEIY